MNDQITPEKYLAWVGQGGRLAERGMEGLFKLYGPRVKSFFRRHRFSDEEAADLLQETFIKVYRSANKFAGQSKVSTWLWTIARNSMLDYLRGKKPTDSIDEMLDGDLLDLDCFTDQHCLQDSVELRDCVHRGFFAFTAEYPERASAMRLAVFEEWNVEELAEFLARTPAATREYLSQCRKKMRVFLEPCRSLIGV
jgi:RNA polymerase sigma-70 factor (ECF subfamily)